MTTSISRRSGRPATIIVLALALVAGCTGTVASPPSSSGPSADLPARAEPWAQRPVVDLSFEIADDLKTATGHEKVVFTPDLRVCELVFRAWPNAPSSANAGTSMVVADITVDGAAVRGVRVLPAGAPADAPGTLIEVPLPNCVETGQSVTAEMNFRLTLGEDTDARVGFQQQPEMMAWIGGGFPLLAWVRGEGWARDDAVSVAGETATSEEFKLASLAVTARSDYKVLGTGAAVGEAPGRLGGTTTHTYTADAVRDVTISVGRIAVTETQVDDIRLHIGLPELEGTQVDREAWAEHLTLAIRRLTPILGPFPYRDLWVSIIPSQTEGIEFPSAIQFGDLRSRQLRGLVEHEMAHQWFYSLVGNNQARDPWIDEAFAMLAQAVVAGQEQSFGIADVPRRVAGDLGRPMWFWNENGGYDDGVYVQGAAVLLEARRKATPERFDPVLRAYIQNNAHRVVKPADVGEAFKDLPEVTDLLREYGAFSGGS